MQRQVPGVLAQVHATPHIDPACHTELPPSLGRLCIRRKAAQRSATMAYFLRLCARLGGAVLTPNGYGHSRSGRVDFESGLSIASPRLTSTHLTTVTVSGSNSGCAARRGRSGNVATG